MKTFILLIPQFLIEESKEIARKKKSRIVFIFWFQLFFFYLKNLKNYHCSLNHSDLPTKTVSLYEASSFFLNEQTIKACVLLSVISFCLQKGTVPQLVIEFLFVNKKKCSWFFKKNLTPSYLDLEISSSSIAIEDEWVVLYL